MKTYAVIGLGKFGSHVAKELIENGEQVIAVDKNEDSIKEFRGICENLFIIDTTDINSLKDAGIAEVDTAIVSIGKNIEASILSVMALKEIGVKEVIAKAYTLIHGKILSKIGTDRVIYPERDAAKRLVKSFSLNPKFEVIDVTNTMKIARFKITAQYANIAAGDLLSRSKSDLKIIAFKRENRWEYEIGEFLVLKNDDVVLLFGNSKELEIFVSNI